MAASEQTYRNQRLLDLVFGVSCVLMLLATLWMFAQDYNREFKQVQRQFRDVEETMNEHLMLDKMPHADAVADKRRALRDARRALEKAREAVRPQERSLVAQRDTQDTAYRGIKAEYDSKMSYFNIAMEHLGKAEPDRRAKLKADVDARSSELDKLQKDLVAAQAALDATDLEFKKLRTTPISIKMGQETVENTLAGFEEEVTRAEDDEKKLTAAFDRYAKLAAQKSWKAGDTFRNLPILDAFESPTRIKQVWLPDLTIDYSFKEVPRFDRCVSCHLGIDRASFDKTTLARLGNSDVAGTLEKKLGAAEKMLRQREAAGEKLGFDVDDLPSQTRGSVWGPTVFLFLSVILIAAILGGIAGSTRLALGIAIAGSIFTVFWGVLMTLMAPKDPSVKVVKLTSGEVQQFCAHPRLDLFVDANSPHPMEKFGCTICHAGQGSATEFNLASHTPATSHQEEEWHKEHGWSANHYWDYPMLSSRFVESSCLKCHHQVTDLVRHGSKDEAKKLVKGYNLVRELGCFGCHEISGIKSGREVGPDLRLEPTPALDYLSASDQEKAKSDPLNPPGTYRKVGPSLRRISEKTNEDWARKWVRAPRGFRPDTRMPHFYGLVNNDPDPNAFEPLPASQQQFPDAEIASIVRYLFLESKAGLEDGKDTTRKIWEGRVAALQADLKKGPLDDRDRKELTDASRRVLDIAILSAATKARQLNAAGLEQRRLQERLQELGRKQMDLQARQPAEELSAAEKKELQDGAKDLDAQTAIIVQSGVLVPLSKQLVGENGTPVELPKEHKAQADNGRRLFTERGCLACHMHQGTEKPGSVPTVSNDADFGPNLSRLAAKIAPEGGEEARRRWLVQWIMNPNVYHPRTRMPITHLSAADASDVAEWLLSQQVTDWQPADVPNPSTEALVSLARVYLGKAPGFTARDVDDFLPANGPTPGIPAERLDAIRKQSPDADELRLEKVTDDNLKWYIGRKAITRLGCYACHDVPGFEPAKPIGTALNDWGKKDPERLAFEDSDIFVKNFYHIVGQRDDRKDPSKPAADWHNVDKKPPYEMLFYEALEHHRREGFLHLKLEQPRSYDYHRPRLAWEDRLRMPQFRFSRAHRRPGESADDYYARLLRESRGEYDAQAEKDEAEAREAAMTFILGLTADSVPLKYLYQPAADRMAEVKGRQVLEKFNCAGCHQVQPGVIEFKPSSDTFRLLEEAHSAIARQAVKTDYPFPNNNAWVGTAQTSPERMVAYAVNPHQPEEEKNQLAFWLTEALRFAGKDRVLRDIPAGQTISILEEDVLDRSDTFGGAFADVMTKQYMPKKDPQLFKLGPDRNNQESRGRLPPPLIREGERVQPNWLYGFLLNPEPVRPTSYVLLRMPKFNMSHEDARTLVDYFASTARLNNPGAGVSAQYLRVDQKDGPFWREQSKEYVERLRSAKKYDTRLAEMKGTWEQYLKRQVADAEAGLDAAKQAVKDAKGDEARKKKQQELDQREKAIKDWKAQLDKKDFAELQKQWENEEAYPTDAVRLLTNSELCLKCHSIGGMKGSEDKGPNLLLAANRLRPDWVERWVAHPKRMFAYDPVMPQNFPKDQDPVQYQEAFVGTPFEKVRAVRDVLMDLPRLTDLPGTRSVVTPVPAGGGK